MSKIEVNEIVKQSGSTLTLGGPGTAVTIACGATTVGMGRTGTVDWCTTAKTSPLTVASGNGYFINTSGGAITVTLPSSPSAGDIVAFKDYGNTWDTNAVTVGRNGSKINGSCNCATLNTESQSVTLIYVDGTKGWQDIHDSTSDVTGTTFISASGGTETNSPCGNYKIHTFTGDGCFAVSSLSSQAANNEVSYIVVAGGGGSSIAGGGAGGFRESKAGVDSYTSSPLEGSTNITVTAQTYPITVGAGGAGAAIPGTAVVGSNSVFSTVTSAGGGLGATNNATGGNGGSGGGGGGGSGPFAGGSGNTPPTSPAQGLDGGVGGNTPPNNAGGGGGGATAAGGTTTSTVSGAGGAGATTSITGSPTAYSGGGGGGARNAPANQGGAGGTGGGGAGKPYSPGNGTSGTANTGGGGGGAGSEDLGGTGGAGGSGVVIIRYKFQ